MRRIRRQDRKRPSEPKRCRCMHHTDTAGWQGKRGGGAGLTALHGPNHAAAFAHPGNTRKGCIHSELERTTRPTIASKETCCIPKDFLFGRPVATPTRTRSVL